MAKLCRRMVMMRVILVGMACLLGQGAWACGELIHSCTFNGGAKTVEVCLNSQDVSYSFGPTGGAPELAMRATIVNVDYRPWSGVGRSISEGVTFYNAGYAYLVYGGFDKLNEGQDEPNPLFGGIFIERDGKKVSELSCDVGSVYWVGYGDGGLYAAKNRAGQCWDLASLTWAACQ